MTTKKRTASKKRSLSKGVKKTARSARAKLRVERQETIKDVKTKSYEIVRLSRVKYFGNAYNFIDIRYFQRDMSEEYVDLYHPTRKGVQLREDLFRKLIDEHFLESLERQMRESD
jgi:hypothetical protein